ncbi:hypothetical protein PoB_000722200 [Plakobranchus ocellatus]|uniref:Uncharacterized protein n=1 Tax=Plakobranchus ocellatus TaxID=259542 RepID=A0AAV3YCV5_9GAST|nr:hypothetical protein PoB_000722200 [Plakobranchus ocellatus]
MIAFTKRKKDARERFWPVVDERSITEKLLHQVLNRSIASLNRPISLASRFREDRVNLAAAKLQSAFGGR